MAETQLFTMSFPAEIAFLPALFEKRQIEVNGVAKGDPRWEIALLFDMNHPDLKRIKEVCKAVAESGEPGVTKDPKAWRYPWSNADTFVAKQEAIAEAAGKDARDNSHLAGKVLLNSHATRYEPKLSVVSGGKIVDYWEEAARLTVKDKFFAGAQVLCEYSFVWYPPGNGRPGVTAYINKVLATGKGVRRGGGRSGSETFAAHIGSLSAVDPTEGAEEY